MEEYAAKFFARVSSAANQTTPFLNAIRSNHNLFNLAHTSLQLQMLCNLWETGAKDKGFGSSLTALYTEMLKQLYLWHVRKQNPYADTSDLSIDEKLIEGLGKVALVGLDARQLMPSQASLKDALQGTGMTIAQLRATGLLKKSAKDAKKSNKLILIVL